MSVLTKCVKIPLTYIETPEISYQEFLKNYWEIQKQIRAVKNRISSEFYLRKWEDARIYAETGEWPKFKKLDFTNTAYHAHKGEIPLYNTANLSQCIKAEVDTLSSHWKDVLKGTRAVDSFKSDQPVVIKGQTLKLEEVGPETIAVISLFSMAIKDKYKVKNGVVRFKCGLKSGSLKAIAARCVTGEYKVCASTLDYNRDKRKMELSLTYSFPHETETAGDPEKILGVDLGVVNAYYTATNFSLDRFYEPGGDIEAFRQKTEALRWKRKKQRPVCGDGSIGHGYKTRVKPVLDVSDRIARYRAHKNHLMSRKIIQEAQRLGCGVIQMEDLTGISEEHKFLKNWSYYDLQMKVKSKAAEAGIEVRLIDPQYTSQRCHKCGYIDAANVPEEARYTKFICQRCGYETVSDFNAARNIALADIVEIIKETRANMKQTEET